VRSGVRFGAVLQRTIHLAAFDAGAPTWKKIRELLDFDPSRDASAPRDAASVVVLRDGARGLEVFCVRRHAKSSFLGGALVFPGGKVDAADGGDAWSERVTAPHLRGPAFAGTAVTASILAIAGARETLEEGAILPVAEALDAAQVDEILAELAAGASLLAVLARRELRLALDALVPWARWVTPVGESRRFDARFFLLELPRGQVGRHDDHETTMSFWGTPQEVLDRAAAGEFFLAPPTARTLELLACAGTVTAAMALAERQSLQPICPQFIGALGDEPPYLALPGDPSHEVRERWVEGPTRYVLRSGRFVSEEPPDTTDRPPVEGRKQET
jgi:8-oxo-dGTP pyrophosphatase MutT (NUDIX family)